MALSNVHGTDLVYTSELDDVVSNKKRHRLIKDSMDPVSSYEFVIILYFSLKRRK